MEEQEAHSVKHPRRDLPFTCSRRTFFRALFQEASVIHGSLKGKEGFRLSELGSLPDGQLARVRPVVHPDHEIFLDQGYVCSRRKRAEATSKLFPTEKENLVAFNMFNGRYDLGQIGGRLAQEMGWDETSAFAHVRDLFLSLIERGVCVPQDPPEPGG
jgi:hypothetical protein